MKKITVMLASLMLAACATSGNSVSSNANMRLGKIVEKQTITQQISRRSPMDIGVGIGGWGGGHVGGAINLSLGSLFGWDSVSSQTVYQYKIEMAKNDFLVIQSDQSLSPNDCVTVYELINDSNYPKISPNAQCKLPVKAAL